MFNKVDALLYHCRRHLVNLSGVLICRLIVILAVIRTLSYAFVKSMKKIWVSKWCINLFNSRIIKTPSIKDRPALKPLCSSTSIPLSLNRRLKTQSNRKEYHIKIVVCKICKHYKVIDINCFCRNFKKYIWTKCMQTQSLNINNP